MPWTSITPIILWAVTALPLAIGLWFVIPKSKITAILLLLIFLAYNLFWMWSVDWAFSNYFLRFVPIVLLFVLFIRYFTGLRLDSWLPKKKPTWILFGVSLAIVAAIILVDVRVARSFRYKNSPNEPKMLLFPLRRGLYVIANGGNALDGIGMNNHFNSLFKPEIPPDPDMAYAVDVFKMTTRGWINNKGPRTNFFGDYLVYEDSVYAPCPGEVVFIEDGHPELPLFSQGPELGNYIVIKCYDYYITLGNMKAGRFFVKTGDQVWFTNMLGQVGNSGMPAIPHLHIHTTLEGWKNGEGEPVPMLFEGLLSVNQLATRNKLFLPQ